MVNISTLGQYLDQIARLKGQQHKMGELSIQISSGKKTQKLSGIGADIMRTTRARVGINSLEVYNSNITNANRRVNMMSIAIREMKAQTESITGGLTLAVQQGDYPDFAAMKDLAGKVLDFVVNLVNGTDGERYLFGGADTTEEPLGGNSLFQSALGEFLPDSSDLTNPPLVASGMIGDWGDGSITTEQFIAAYHGASDTVLGFSNALTSGTAGKTTVRVGDKAEFDYTTLANKTAMKDIVMALNVLVNMPPPEYAPGALNDPTATTLAEDTSPFPPAEKQENFFAVINDLNVTLNKAIDQLTQEEFKLSQVQAQITKIKTSHTDQINAYKNIVDEIENADITEAAAKVTQMEIQLQASYSVTALISQLSLANYLR